jgi:hypothetical protein
MNISKDQKNNRREYGEYHRIFPPNIKPEPGDQESYRGKPAQNCQNVETETVRLKEYRFFTNPCALRKVCHLPHHAHPIFVILGWTVPA